MSCIIDRYSYGPTVAVFFSLPLSRCFPKPLSGPPAMSHQTWKSTSRVHSDSVPMLTAVTLYLPIWVPGPLGSDGSPKAQAMTVNACTSYCVLGYYATTDLTRAFTTEIVNHINNPATANGNLENIYSGNAVARTKTYTKQDLTKCSRKPDASGPPQMQFHPTWASCP